MDETAAGAVDLDRAATEIGRLEALADALDFRLSSPEATNGGSG